MTTCDATKKAKKGAIPKSCRFPATFYDPIRKERLCGIHARDRRGAIAGTGPSWYES